MFLFLHIFHTFITFFLFTSLIVHAIIQKNQIYQTDEAEITAMMPSQIVRIAESRIRNKLSNGPLRAQSNAAPDSSSERGRAEYSATWGHTSVAGDMLVSR